MEDSDLRNNIIKLRHYDETEKMAHDPLKVRAKENLKSLNFDVLVSFEAHIRNVSVQYPMQMLSRRVNVSKSLQGI